jgi:hypothetical protein
MPSAISDSRKLRKTKQLWTVEPLATGMESVLCTSTKPATPVPMCQKSHTLIKIYSECQQGISSRSESAIMKIQIPMSFLVL